jgi:hypothetical protein
VTQLCFGHIEIANFAVHMPEIIAGVIAHGMKYRVSLWSPQAAKGGSFSKSGKNGSDIAAFGLCRANLLGNKFSRTFSALEFGCEVVGIGARNFAVNEDDQVNFKSDFGEVGESERSPGGTAYEATAGKDVVEGSLADASRWGNEVARGRISDGPENIDGVTVAGDGTTRCWPETSVNCHRKRQAVMGFSEWFSR